MSINLTNVTKTYPGPPSSTPTRVLDRIDLHFEAGDYACIQGRSGSGKSTLLHLIAGIDRPTTGDVVVNEHALHRLDETALAAFRATNIGIVFQFFQLLSALTVEENVLIAMEFGNCIPASKRRQRARSLLDELGLSAKLNAFPGVLSGGEQQRVAVARALANEPAVVIADEPTGNLDTQSAAVVHGLFETIARSGITVLVVTHEIESVAHYDRKIWIEDGRITPQHGAA